MRVFFAIEPDADSRRQIESLIRLAEPQLRRCGRITPVKDIHLTLLFVGDWPDDTISDLSSMLDQTAGTTPPFTIRFDHFGAFRRGRQGLHGKAEPAILWLGDSTHVPGKSSGQPDHAALEMLVSQLRGSARRLGMAVETRPFTPHLTLTRKMPGEAVDDMLQSLPAFAPILFNVREITLMQSIPKDGHMCYEPVKRAILRGGT